MVLHQQLTRICVASESGSFGSSSAPDLHHSRAERTRRMFLRAPKFLTLLLSLSSLIFAFIEQHSNAPLTLLLFGAGMVSMASFSRRHFAKEE
jgi:O-antigen/teichoic acid export membrane protein